MKHFTNHSQKRLKERLPELDQAGRKALVSKALRYGKCAISFYDSNPKLCNYLLRKGNRCNVKYYQGKVFVFDKITNSLVTMYKMPETY